MVASLYVCILQLNFEEIEKLKNENKPLGRRDNVVVQEIDGEVLIYDLVKNKAFCLNNTAALVWQSCDGKKTIAEISDWLGKQLNSQTNEDIVWLALDQLSKENLIVKETKPVSKFAGLSRRQVIKQVGLATVIALPIITSLTAPLAIHAASACVAGGTCTCDLSMGTTNGEICVSTAGMCIDTACQCQRINQGNGAGTCVP